MKKQTKTSISNTKVSKQQPKLKSSFKAQYLVIILLTIILYGNTLSNKYALDDLYAITGNAYTQKGFSGIPQLLSKDFFAGYYQDQQVLLTGGRYRPLSLVSFAIEHQFFGNNPGFSHFVNLVLYALTACLLLVFLRKLIHDKAPGGWQFSIPFIAALIFTAHPVHTEVVANIKGRDEILALLFSLVAAVYYLKFLDSKRSINLLYVFISFFLGCLSKENAMLFIFLIPITAYYFRDFKIKDNLLAVIPILLAGGLFLIIRWCVAGGISNPPSAELLDNPFIQAGIGQKYATIIYTLGVYVKLLFFPHPLTWDYYPYHISLMSWGDIRVILSLLLYVLFIIIAVAGIRKKGVLSYAVWVYMIGIILVSNIIFQVGVFMAERFLYLPSVGFCLAVAWLMVAKLFPLIKKEHQRKHATTGLLLIILVLFAFKTISRNTIWKDDYTLYTTDVTISSNSAKSNNIAGQWYAWAANQTVNAANRESLMAKAQEMVSKAVNIHPGYMDAWFRLGNIIFDYKRDADSAVACYLHILKKDPEEENVFKNLNIVINSLDNNQHKIDLWKKILAVTPDRYEPNFYLANFYFETDQAMSLSYAEKARLARPRDAANLKVLANGYLNQRDYKRALALFEEYLQINPDDSAMRKTRNKLVYYLKGE